LLIGGVAGRRGATGRGVVFGVGKGGGGSGGEVRGAKGAVQGFGNDGSVTPRPPWGEGPAGTARAPRPGGGVNPKCLSPRGLACQGGRNGRRLRRRRPDHERRLADPPMRRVGTGCPRRPDHGKECRPRARPDRRGGGERPDYTRGR